MTKREGRQYKYWCSLLGLAIGDALGSVAGFKAPGNVEPLTWLNLWKQRSGHFIKQILSEKEHCWQ
jgi:ADP-ribosylglycohydrolase